MKSTTSPLKIHFIAIGGAIMHNLALALQAKGHTVTGSDDAIYDPAKSNLEAANLAYYTGWNADFIVPNIDLILLGMHARPNNPELIRAQELGLRIVSFPEYVAELSQEKTRIVVGGSHGKTTTTAMILHILSSLKMEFDYLVGSSIQGFDLSVKLSDAPLIVIEGDEYLSSPLDKKSKFLWYKPHISILTGIAWDHINVFPTWEEYVATFEKYIAQHNTENTLIWYKNDSTLDALMKQAKCSSIPYETPNYSIVNHQYFYHFEEKKYPLSIVGEHNLQNLEAAMLALAPLEISKETCLKAIEDFSGAGKRMEKIFENDSQIIFRDFAHSPSKLKATVDALRNTYPERKLLALFELHTFSSLNEAFLPLYTDAMAQADVSIVFYDEHVFAHKNMPILQASFVKECFGNIQVITNKEALETSINQLLASGYSGLLMSSGKFENAIFDLPK